ncbi:hypothetical protein BVIET440_50374 [Burkholderia vietnamiensis]
MRISGEARGRNGARRPAGSAPRPRGLWLGCLRRCIVRPAWLHHLSRTCRHPRLSGDQVRRTIGMEDYNTYTSLCVWHYNVVRMICGLSNVDGPLRHAIPAPVCAPVFFCRLTRTPTEWKLQ